MTKTFLFVMSMVVGGGVAIGLALGDWQANPPPHGGIDHPATATAQP